MLMVHQYFFLSLQPDINQLTYTTNETDLIIRNPCNSCDIGFC